MAFLGPRWAKIASRCVNIGPIQSERERERDRDKDKETGTKTERERETERDLTFSLCWAGARLSGVSL